VDPSGRPTDPSERPVESSSRKSRSRTLGVRVAGPRTPRIVAIRGVGERRQPLIWNDVSHGAACWTIAGAAGPIVGQASGPGGAVRRLVGRFNHLAAGDGVVSRLGWRSRRGWPGTRHGDWRSGRSARSRARFRSWSEASPRRTVAIVGRTRWRGTAGLPEQQMERSAPPEASTATPIDTPVGRGDRGAAPVNEPAPM